MKPRIVRYEGGELKLNDTVSLTEALCPGISQFIGKELIVTDGTTLLGADDKAGVAEIMAACRAADRASGDRPHRASCASCFTTDEEIGNGVDRLRPCESLRCDRSATRSTAASDRRDLSMRTSTRRTPVLTVHGIGVHPGEREGRDGERGRRSRWNLLATAAHRTKMPANTEGYEGFYHVCATWTAR